MCAFCFFFFFKQKTAYERRISDWSSDVCSSDLNGLVLDRIGYGPGGVVAVTVRRLVGGALAVAGVIVCVAGATGSPAPWMLLLPFIAGAGIAWQQGTNGRLGQRVGTALRTEEHTSELQSLMRNSYAGFCLK